MFRHVRKLRLFYRLNQQLFCRVRAMVRDFGFHLHATSDYLRIHRVLPNKPNTASLIHNPLRNRLPHRSGERHRNDRHQCQMGQVLSGRNLLWQWSFLDLPWFKWQRRMGICLCRDQSHLHCTCRPNSHRFGGLSHGQILFWRVSKRGKQVKRKTDRSSLHRRIHWLPASMSLNII